MPKPEKEAKVREIKERLEGSEAAVLVDYRGLSVPDIGEVRTALLDVDAQFSVVKNTLTKLAVREAGLTDLEEFLEGPTAIAYVRGDVVMGAKALIDAAKKFPVMEVKAGFAEGRILTADQIKELASLDSREAMLAKIAGLFGAHMSKAAYLFQALQSKFLSLLEAYKEKLPGEEAPAEAEAPAAEEASVEPEAPEAAAEQPSPNGDQPTTEPEGEPPTTEPTTEPPTTEPSETEETTEPSTKEEG